MIRGGCNWIESRGYVALFLVLFVGKSAAAQIAINPSTPPAVNQGSTFQFRANAAGTWSCAGTDSAGGASACKGSIKAATGLYTAPATVTAQQSEGGYQLLPNNHIYNTNISAFPVASDSASLIAGAGTSKVSFFESAWPINYTSPSTPTENMLFVVSGNNGSYQVPAYPGVWPTEIKIEGGWISDQTTGGEVDHHLVTIDTTTGSMQDMYLLWPLNQQRRYPNTNGYSGVKYTPSSYGLPANGSSDAAGLYIQPLTLRLQEMEQAVAKSGAIRHALRMSLQNGYIKFGAGSFIWPATTTTSAGGGVVP
jgi:hypothetical protein